MTEKQRAFIKAYAQTRDEKQAAIQAGYKRQDAGRMAKRTMANKQVRQALLAEGVPLPDERAEETMRRRIAGHMAEGTLKASEEFRAMELLWKLEREQERTEEKQNEGKIKTVRFEGVLEQWSR